MIKNSWRDPHPLRGRKKNTTARILKILLKRSIIPPQTSVLPPRSTRVRAPKGRGLYTFLSFPQDLIHNIVKKETPPLKAAQGNQYKKNLPRRSYKPPARSLICEDTANLVKYITPWEKWYYGFPSIAEPFYFPLNGLICLIKGKPLLKYLEGLCLPSAKQKGFTEIKVYLGWNMAKSIVSPFMQIKGTKYIGINVVILYLPAKLLARAGTLFFNRFWNFWHSLE